MAMPVGLENCSRFGSGGAATEGEEGEGQEEHPGTRRDRGCRAAAGLRAAVVLDLPVRVPGDRVDAAGGVLAGLADQVADALLAGEVLRADSAEAAAAVGTTFDPETRRGAAALRTILGTIDALLADDGITDPVAAAGPTVRRAGLAGLRVLACAVLARPCAHAAVPGAGVAVLAPGEVAGSVSAAIAAVVAAGRTVLVLSADPVPAAAAAVSAITGTVEAVLTDRGIAFPVTAAGAAV